MAHLKTVLLCELIEWSKEQAREHRKKANWMRREIGAGKKQGMELDAARHFVRIEDVLANRERIHQSAFRRMAK